MSKREVRSKVEVRADESRTSPGRITGTMIEMGRVASDRRELFVPGSLRWPHNGIRLVKRHYGGEDETIMRFQPKQDGAKLMIDEALPDTELGRLIAAEVRSGKRRDMSIEFFPSEESEVAGVREIRSAIVDAVLVAESGTGVYDQAKVEVRAKAKVPALWL